MTASVQDIKIALAKLDASNDNHWTSEGLPRLETVRLFAGDQSVNREQVTQAAPQFMRGAPPTPPTTPAPAEIPAVNAAPAGITQVPTPPVQVALTPPPGLPSSEAVTGNPLAMPPPVSSDKIEDLQKQLSEIERELHQIGKAKAEIAKAEKERNDAADDLRVRIGKLTPRNDNQHAIMAYLARQQTVRDARAAQIGRARAFESDVGVKLTDLIPKKAPIDAAMARKTGYGLKRPGT